MKITEGKETSFEGTVEVCAHRVRFSYWDFEPRELTDEFKGNLENHAEERAKECIMEGYVAGELNCYGRTDERTIYRVAPNSGDDGEEIRGWWEIIRG